MYLAHTAPCRAHTLRLLGTIKQQDENLCPECPHGQQTAELTAELLLFIWGGVCEKERERMREKEDRDRGGGGREKQEEEEGGRDGRGRIRKRTEEGKTGEGRGGEGMAGEGESEFCSLSLCVVRFTCH